QTDVAKVARPIAATNSKTQRSVASWIWGAYYSLAVFYVVSGGYDVAMVFVNANRVILGEKLGFGFWSYIGLAIGGLTSLLGIGLLLRLELARAIVNFFCGLQILFGLLGLAGSVLGTMFAGALGLVMVFMQIVQIAAAAFMIYVIGETERVGPSI
ncbi:MAG: hypothetical protein J0H02_06230, partial [Armatimonadetes bacterium]|nr:hypothetical protein [Armatimonadota bacterium]